MRCPYCNQDNTRVVDSRPVEETNSIRRRRLCDSCGRRFTTYENVETIPLTVIKKNLNREQYDRNKLINGVRRACYKRPIASDKLEAMIDAIEGDIFNAEDKEISSRSSNRAMNTACSTSCCAARLDTITWNLFSSSGMAGLPNCLIHHGSDFIQRVVRCTV